MTQEDILSTIQSLPAHQQYAIASSILDRLTLSGQVTLSDSMRDEIRRRDIESEQNPTNGEPWKDVKKQIFDA